MEVHGLVREISMDPTMLVVFESAVAQFPNEPAVIFEDRVMTYLELDQKANWLAHRLQEMSLTTPNTVVALFLERSDLMVIGILGTWKAGGAYVALAPNYPSERIKFIMADTKATIICTDELNFSKISAYVPNADRICNLSKHFGKGDPSVASPRPPPSIGTTPDDLSHILYTSGTTGQPKGVMVLRQTLINECLDYSLRYGFKKGQKEVIVHFLNYVFNAATVPLLTAFAFGFPLVIVRPSLLLESEKLYEYLSRHGITHIDSTPSLVHRLDLSRIPTLRRVAVGGEMLRTEVYNRAKAALPMLDFFNIYGNSEGTLCIMYSRVENEKDNRIFRNVSVNKHCMVLTPENQLADIGTVGELGISGYGLARGYLNNEKLTKEKFIPSIFGRPEVIYKTGDLVRQHANGEIEIIGRMDFQVKIRGYRVELEEIEAVMDSFPGVAASAVVAKNLEQSDQATIHGYFVLKPDAKPDSESLLMEHIQKHLPDYMIPSRLVQLKEMPLTPNGKINRNELPLPPLEHQPISDQLPLKNSETSEGVSKLSKIWKEVLNFAEEGVTQGYEYDFFEAGGNSLLAMRLAERVNEEFGTTIDASHVFNYSTIAEFHHNLPIPLLS